MKHRTALVIFLVTFGCKPVAESQTVQPRTAAVPIPASVSAARRTPIVVVAHNVLPSVVNIQSESVIRQRQVDPFFDPFGMFGGQTRAYTAQSLGSGFVWSSDGVIVTNNHVVEGASKITVNFQDGTQTSAKLVGVDPDSDVAVLRVDAKNLPAAPVGTSSDLMIGETVIAVGNPFGLSGSVTTGVVSALGRSVPSKEAGRTFTDFVQTDASINPGNSGGPLLNIEGKVVGINTAIYVNAQGIGFAIPVDRARKVVQDILRYGQVHAAWIGAVTATVTPEESRRLGLRATKGALVSRVFSGSPAEGAGIKAGDVITGVGDRPVDSREAFSTYTATVAPGQPLTLAVMHGNATSHTTVRPVDAPANLGLRILSEVAGIDAANSGRLLVSGIASGSRAEKIGLSRGDAIVGVNGVEVTSIKDLNDEVAKAAERSAFILDVLHGGVIYELTFPMAV
jgi:serine protease Do